jgi:hypothetical protein
MDEAALGEVQAALPRRLPNPEAPRAEGPLPLSKAGRRRHNVLALCCTRGRVRCDVSAQEPPRLPVSLRTSGAAMQGCVSNSDLVMPPVPHLRSRQVSTPFDPTDPAGSAARSAARRRITPGSCVALAQGSRVDTSASAPARRPSAEPEDFDAPRGSRCSIPRCRSSRLEPECRRAEPRGPGWALPTRPAHPRCRASPSGGCRAADPRIDARAAAGHLALLPGRWRGIRHHSLISTPLGGSPQLELRDPSDGRGRPRRGPGRVAASTPEPRGASCRGTLASLEGGSTAA